MTSILGHVLFDLLFEPLVLAVGHFILKLFGVPPLQSKKLDSGLAGLIGLIVWAAVVLTIGLLW